VIIAMHHDQDMRNMGGLRKYMPITWITSLIGSLALIGTPFFAGFYSKDSIIMAVGESTIPGSGFAFAAILAGVFITALYSFRMYFMVFHGEERMDHHTKEHLHETPWVVTVPLVLLAIPSVVIGAIFVMDMPFGNFFGQAIFVAPEHDVLAKVGQHVHGWWAMALHGFMSWPFLLASGGVATAWLLHKKGLDIPVVLEQRFGLLYRILDNKYWADELYANVFAAGGRGLGTGLWKVGDVALIDGLMVNGSARVVGMLSGIVRRLQSGYLYHYAFAMLVGLLALFSLFIFR
jgi:NADH-quinone oxidoreductase subunit L